MSSHTVLSRDRSEALFTGFRTARRGRKVVYNNLLNKPSVLSLDTNRLGDNIRLDFTYHYAALQMSLLVRRWQELAWTPLGAVAHVTRGSIATPIKRRVGVHTNDWKNGFWYANKLTINVQDISTRLTVRHWRYPTGKSGARMRKDFWPARRKSRSKIYGLCAANQTNRGGAL